MDVPFDSNASFRVPVIVVARLNAVVALGQPRQPRWGQTSPVQLYEADVQIENVLTGTAAVKSCISSSQQARGPDRLAWGYLVKPADGIEGIARFSSSDRIMECSEPFVMIWLTASFKSLAVLIRPLNAKLGAGLATNSATFFWTAAVDARTPN